MKNRLLIFLSAAVAFCCCGHMTSAQDEGYDVFVPIAKYIRLGDAEKLSAWFDDSLEISIISNTSDSSKNQAKQILKSFFAEYTPHQFHISHTAEKANMKYALGSLSAGGESFSVTIFIRAKGDSYKIQELKIERM